MTEVVGSLKEDLGEIGEVVVAMVEEKEEYLLVCQRKFKEKREEWKKSLMGSKFMANGEECLDGWVGVGGGEVKGGGVDFGVSRTLLGEIPGEIIGESGGEVFGFDG
ncbi:hypothetical protein Tco_0851947 [Tanacetum coccineum]